MKYQDSIDEAIRIERFKNNKTYKEIADKLQISIYRVTKVIKNEPKRRGQKRRKNRKN